MVTLLVERGADLNARDSRGDTALAVAAANGHNRAVALLRDLGARG